MANVLSAPIGIAASASSNGSVVTISTGMALGGLTPVANQITGPGTTITTSSPFINMTQTWNAGGVTFSAAVINVTDTASAAASLLLDLQVGGVSKFNVTKAGAIGALGQITFATGLGAISQIQGPSDQPLQLNSGTGQNLNLNAPAGSGIFLAPNGGAYNWAFSASGPLVTNNTGIKGIIGANAVSSDVVPGAFIFQAQSAWAQASTNNTGANLTLAGGIGRRFLTVVLFSQASMAGSTITITVNGSATTLTENGTTVAGSNWAALTSNNATATSIATAIGGVTGVTATAVGAVVYVSQSSAGTTYTLAIARSAASAGMTATSGVNGVVNLSGNIFMVYAGSKQVALVGSNGILAFDAGTSNPASTSALRGNGAKLQAVLADESGHATFTAGAFETINTGAFGWPSSNDPTAAMDTALARNAAGAVVVTAGSGTTAAGTIGATQGLFTTGTVSVSTPSVSTSQTQNALSGTVNANLFAMTFADGGTTSTTTAVACYINPTINYTAASKTGSYTGLLIDAVETSLPSGTNYLLRCRAGAAGTTDVLKLTNVGALTIQANITSSAGNIQCGAGNSYIFAGRTAISSGADGTLTIQNNAQNSTTLAMTSAGGITTYKNIATAGWGLPSIYGAGTTAGATAQVTSAAAYTVGAADGTFLITCNILVTTATTHSFTAEVAYTDEGNTARVLTLSYTLVAGGTLSTLVTNVNGTVPYEYVPMCIRAKASTSITVRTNSGGTYTSVVFNINAGIQQVA